MILAPPTSLLMKVLQNVGLDCQKTLCLTKSPFFGQDPYSGSTALSVFDSTKKALEKVHGENWGMCYEFALGQTCVDRLQSKSGLVAC